VLERQQFVSSDKICMQCSKLGKPKGVLPGFGVGVEVREKDTGQIVGYLDARCKDDWAKRNGESRFSFRPW
jgi:hypothetical protein